MNVCSEIRGKGVFSREELKGILYGVLERWKDARRVLAIPPDFTRFHSQAGLITQLVYAYFGDRLKAILPALGTHMPMSQDETAKMYPGIHPDLFRVHKWREDLLTLGEVPASFIEEVSEGKVSYPWPAQVNKMLVEGGFDLILSVGQIVPHEVSGMANYNKNIFVGTGGKEAIDKSHFLGAVWGVERVMGRPGNPVRKMLNYASEHFGSQLPLQYVMTVVDKDAGGGHGVKGLFIGNDHDTFLKACELSLQVNLTLLKEPLKKVVVYLDPEEYKSTWLGNKSIYRTRMAIADGGELIVLGPGIRSFGEDPEIDRLIRKYGYRTTPEVMKMVDTNKDLRENLSVAAHLIHGTHEGRFRVIYCPGHLCRSDIENVGYSYGSPGEMMNLYYAKHMKPGFNRNKKGDPFYFIDNPGQGLWTCEENFM